MAAGASGASGSSTEAGPPERITPFGRIALNASSAFWNGTISQETFSSRTRRAMSWVTCEPRSMMRILSWPASRSVSAPRTREESRTVIPTLCAGRRACGQGRCFRPAKPAVIYPLRGQAAFNAVPFAKLIATAVISAFQLLVALAVIAAAFLDPFQTAVGITRLVGVVLIEASVHAGLSRRLARIFRGHGRWEHGVSGRLGRCRRGGSRRARGRSGGGRICAALGFAEIAPTLPAESTRGFGRLVLGAAFLHRERLRRLSRSNNHRAGERQEACARRNLADRHGKPPGGRWRRHPLPILPSSASLFARGMNG